MCTGLNGESILGVTKGVKRQTLVTDHSELEITDLLLHREDIGFSLFNNLSHFIQCSVVTSVYVDCGSCPDTGLEI